MNPEPRQRDDYSPRQIEAAHRVLVDLGQVLAAFEDCMVVIGGWVPDVLLERADQARVGSIDVDLALESTTIISEILSVSFLPVLRLIRAESPELCIAQQRRQIPEVNR